MDISGNKPSFFERLSSLLLREPEDREQLIQLLHSACERNLLDADALSITEGALSASETSVRDVMVPRAQMDTVDANDPVDDIFRFVIETAHSRFPVHDGDRDNIIGILMAKDLLRAHAEKSFNLRDCLRPVVFIPESKRLNVLLREFRVSRNHMAIVVDEFGGVAGLVTIEDVLEQIVGDIEDEYDFDEAHDNIRVDRSGRYHVKAQTKIDDFNEAFGCRLLADGADTIGGVLLSRLGRVPKRNGIDRHRRPAHPGAACGRAPALYAARRDAAAGRRPRSGRVKLQSSLLKLLLAALLGAASVLAFAPFEWYFIGWLTMAGLFALLRSTTGWRQAALIGFAFGSGWFGVGTSWVFVSLSVFGGLPPAIAGIATALFCAVLAFFPAFAAAGFVRFRPESALLQAGTYAAIWTLAEWVRSWLFTGFPWLSLGYSQAPPSIFSGIAPVLGVYGVSLATALFSALLVVAAGAVSINQRVIVSALAIALLGAGAGLRAMSWSEPTGVPVRVALLQGNVPQDLKWRPEKLGESLQIYDRLMREHPATLTVLPETAIPAFLDQIPPQYLERLLTHALDQQGDLLFGVAVGDGQRYANAAASIGLSPTQLYSKSHLVPFGEFVPPGFQWFLDMMRIPMSNFMPGPDRQPPLEIGGQRVAVNICYEDVFGTEIIRALPEATLLVNLSNTAWFGDSLAQPQHLQIAQLRALETGRPMLRATNTGMTAVVGADGRVQAVLPPFIRDALVVEVSGHSGTTPYVRWGNAAVLLLCLLLLLPAGLRRAAATLPDACKTK